MEATVNTIYGTLTYSAAVPGHKINAVIRGIEFIEENISELKWNRITARGRVYFEQTINGHRLRLSPLIAAYQDLGVFTSFQNKHAPVHVDGRRICIRVANPNHSAIHLDYIGTLVLLFNSENPLSSYPSTLLRALYPEDFGRHLGGQNRRDRDLLDHHRVQVMTDFRAHVQSPETALEYARNELGRDDWRIVRDSFDWGLRPDMAELFSLHMLSTETDSQEDALWGLNLALMVFEGPRREALIRESLRHPFAEIRSHAVHHFHPSSEQEAKVRLFPLLQATEASMLVAHRKLRMFPGLTQSLIEETESLLEEPHEFNMHVLLLSWISGLKNVDERVHPFLASLQPHELSFALQSIRTYGSWLDRFAEKWVEQPFEGVHRALVKSVVSNSNANLMPVFEPLIQRGSGTLQTLILSNMDGLTEQEAHIILDHASRSSWGFVFTFCCRTVELKYPDWPGRAGMYRRWLQHERGTIRRACKRGLVELDLA